MEIGHGMLRGWIHCHHLVKRRFNNVDVEIEYDIITGWLAEDGEVKSVNIGGTTNFSEVAEFRPDEPIVITYHTLKENEPDK